MSDFTVNIVGGIDQATTSATGQGSTQQVISAANAVKFGLNDDGTNKAMVNKYFGHTPNDCYLHSPTPWNDLYKTYNWPQVQTNLQFVSATVSSFTSQLQAVNTVLLQNTGTVPATFHADMSKTMTNTSTSSWTSSDTVSVTQTIKYGISFLGTGGGGETSFGYTHTWGQGGEESKAIELGLTQGVSVELQPGKKVYVDLMASQGNMTVDVVYNASLLGDLAVNYNPTYKSHHFFALDVNGVLSANAKPTSTRITQQIKVQFYTSASVVMRDGDGSKATARTLWKAGSKPGPAPGKTAVHVVA